MSVMGSVWNAVRGRVSADKNRYMKDQYDLDLTYITDRVIAMGFPADGMESTYRNNIDDVASMLHKTHPDHFMLFNLSERPYDYSKFKLRVQDWCGWPDHHAPPLPKLFAILRSVHSWLLEDPENVVVVHCLAGKGRTGTIIGAYFLYTGLFEDPDKALHYFAVKRSMNNWGVTGPSQMRYVRYVGDIIYKRITPLPTILTLAYLHLSSAPAFGGSFGTYALGRSGGFCPFIHVYELDSDTGKKLLYTSQSEDQEPQSFAANQPITFEIECAVKGDILIEVYHVTPFYRTEQTMRIQFNVGMLRSNVYRLAKADIDVANQDKRFPSSFFVDLGFHNPSARKSADKDNNNNVTSEPKKVEPEDKWWTDKPVGDGSVAFFDIMKLKEAKLLNVLSQARLEKGGWLTKQGHNVKNWKRRWFVLKDPTLSYYVKPNTVTPAGVIVLDDILAIVSSKNIYDSKAFNRSDSFGSTNVMYSSANNVSDRPPFWFEIITKSKQYLICAESEQDLVDWVDSIEFVMNQRDTILREPMSSPVRRYSAAEQGSSRGPDDRRGLVTSQPLPAPKHDAIPLHSSGSAPSPRLAPIDLAESPGHRRQPSAEVGNSLTEEESVPRRKERSKSASEAADLLIPPEPPTLVISPPIENNNNSKEPPKLPLQSSLEKDFVVMQ